MDYFNSKLASLSDTSRLSGYRSQIASPSGLDISTSGLSSSYKSSNSSLLTCPTSSYLGSSKDKSYLGRSTKYSDYGASFGSKYSSPYSSSYAVGGNSILDYKSAASTSLDGLTSNYSNSYLSKSARDNSYLSSRSSHLTSPTFDLNPYLSTPTSFSTGNHYHPTHSTPRDLGTSYSLQSKSHLSSQPSSSSFGSSLGQYSKSSSYSLTPFESRRSAHTPDYHHYSSGRQLSTTASATRASTSLSPPTVQQATKNAVHHSIKDSIDVVKKAKENLRAHISRRLSDSSDSFDESDSKDSNCQYLTSRATSPLEIDELKCSNSFFDTCKYRNRNRLLSRKKTKAYPVSDKTRRRQLKNVLIQVDTIDLDVSSGRTAPVQTSASKPTSTPIPTVTKHAVQPPVEIKQPHIQEEAPKPSVPVNRNVPDDPISSGVSSGPSASTSKQSGFIPKYRRSSAFSQEIDSNGVSNEASSEKPLWRKNLIGKGQLQQQEEESRPDASVKQSSFAGKQWKSKLNQSVPSSLQKEGIKSSSNQSQNSGLSLKESLEKVRKWKKQLEDTQSRIKEDEAADDDNSIFGKDDWKKKYVPAKNCAKMPAAAGPQQTDGIVRLASLKKLPSNQSVGSESVQSKTKPSTKSSHKSPSRRKAKNVISDIVDSVNDPKLPEDSGLKKVDIAESERNFSLLPDLVKSSEEKLHHIKTKQAGFIGQMIDIDSLLGYSEVDEDVDDANKKFERRRKISGMITADMTDFEIALFDLKLPTDDLDSDLFLPHFLPSDLVQRMTVNVSSMKEMENSSSFDIFSCDSILDAPVPKTPDVPLFPIPIFDYGPRQGGQFGDKCSTDKTNVLHSKSHDIVAMLGQNGNSSIDSRESDTISSSQESDERIGNRAVMKKNYVNSRRSNAGSSIRHDSMTSDKLVDIESDDTDGSVKRSGRVYPENYSSMAIRRVLTYHKNSGHVPMEAVLKICRISGDYKTESHTEGQRLCPFCDLDEGLEHLGVDVKKLEDCCLALHSRGINESYLKVPAIALVKGSISEEIQIQLQTHKLLLRAKVTAFLEKIKVSSIPSLEVVLYSLKSVTKKSEEFLRNFTELKGIHSVLELVSTFSLKSRKSVSWGAYNLDRLLLRALAQMLTNTPSMRILARDDKVVKWLMSLVLLKHPLDLVTASLLIMILMMRCSDITASLIYKNIMENSKKRGITLWTYLVDMLKSESDQSKNGNCSKDLDQYCMHFINILLKMLPDTDSSLDFSDHLEELEFEKHVQLRSYTAQKKSLQDLFAAYEDILKRIDMAESYTDNVNLSTTTSNEGFIKKKPPRNLGRKSRRFEKWAKDCPSLLEKVPNRENNLRIINENEQKVHVSKKDVTLQVQDKQNETPGSLDDVCFVGLLEKAKMGLNAGQVSGRERLKPAPNEGKECLNKLPEKNEVELKWEQALARPVGILKVQDLDFTDLTEVDELNYLESQPVGGSAPGFKGGLSNLKPLISKTGWSNQKQQQPVNSQLPPPPPLISGMFPPPPPPFLGPVPPPPPFAGFVPPPPPFLGPVPPPPPFFGPAPPPPPISSHSIPPPPLGSTFLPPPFLNGLPPLLNISSSLQKQQNDSSRRTLRLYWKEAKGEFYTPSGRTMETIWGRVAREIGVIKIDKKNFEELFETKTSDIKIKKADSAKKELSVLDSKRSNAINIALTSLPPVAAIKVAILKMDDEVLKKEGIEKILTTMLPTEEEVTKITEVQINCPDETNLGSAEKFLMVISSISEIKSRLRLWLYMLDFDTLEMELASHMNDLKLSIKQVKSSHTFKYVLSNLLAFGNCLNNVKTHGFTIDYLSKVSEVKDAAKKHSLLHHLVATMLDHHGNEITDLFSDLDAVHGCSRMDWDEVSEKIDKLETTCKSSWEDLRKISMHESNPAVRKRLSESLADFAERIMLMKTVHHRLNHRFRHLLLYLGYPAKSVEEVKTGPILKIISNFSAEFKQTRDKILKHKLKKDIKELKTLEYQRKKIALALSSRSDPKIGGRGENDDLGTMVSSWFDPDYSKPSTSLSRLGSTYTSEAETGDEDLLEAACRSVSRPTRNKKRMSMTGDRLHSSWKESLANRDRSIY